jgi:hypothetical protein
MISIAQNRKRHDKRTNCQRRRQFEHLERRDMFAGLPGMIALDAMDDVQGECHNVALSPTADPTSARSHLTPQTRFETLQSAGLVMPGPAIRHHGELTVKDYGAVNVSPRFLASLPVAPIKSRNSQINDQVFSEVQPVWSVSHSAVDALTPSIGTSVKIDMAPPSDSGSSRGSAELDVLGYSAAATVDLDLADGSVSLGVEAGVYLLAAAAEGQFETDPVKVGGIEIVGRGEGSTSVIVGALVGADVTLGVQGLELSSRIVVGAELTAEGQVTADIGGLEATVGGEAIVYVVAGLDASVAATAAGIQLEATAFAGDRFEVTGEAELGGVGVETTAEVWAGIGCAAQADVCFKDGKIIAELGLGAALGVGAKLELGFSIDVGEVRDNVVEAAEHASAFVIDAVQHVDAAADRVGAFVTDTADQASKLVHNAGSEVKEAVHQVADKVERAANNVSKFFKKLF